MKYSLVQKISVSFILVIIISITLISTLSNIFFENNFREYVIEKQNQKNNDLVYSVSQLYKGNKTWEVNSIENLGVAALEEGMIIKVKDVDGNIIWDATVHNNGLCSQMIEHMGNNMISKYPNLNGGYIETKYDINTNNNSIIGTLEIGYYGPFYFNDSDLIFINGINKVILGVGAFSMLISLIIGSIISKRISLPILKVINKTKLISDGYFDDRIEEKSNTIEISQLITSVNDLANSLQKQDILRKRLTSDVAHELRTPLTSLQGNLEAIIDGVWQPTEERLKSCHEEILRITRLVSDLEELIQYESDNLILNKTLFNLSETIQNTIINLEKEYISKEITVEFNNEVENIFADKDKITQVIINILSNAIKYNKIGGNIEIKIIKDENKIIIIFKDNGVGISKDDVSHIFERFYRADKSRNRSTGGSGIGLAISKAIIEAHGGNITANSELNKGTEIIVTLFSKI
jgi:two-component system, OmpR family, sensor histidine kinase BaeS